MFIACKLPQGLQINHNGRAITLRGANANYNGDLATPLNMLTADINGWGLTELTDKADVEAFKDWTGKMTKGPDGKDLAEPYPPLANRSIVYGDTKDAVVKETEKDAPKTGFEAIDPEHDKAMKADGIQTDAENMKKK